MKYRTILAVVDESDASAAVITAALSIGSEMAAYVEALHVEPDPRTLLMMPARIPDDGRTFEDHVDALRSGVSQRQAHVREQFGDRCVAEEVPMLDDAESAEPDRLNAYLRRVTGERSIEVAQRARSFDLIVMASPYIPAGSADRATFEAGLFRSGRPVPVVPPGVSVGSLQSIAIAWNGSREAVHAVTAAMPLLNRATDVCLIAIAEDRRAYRLDEFAWYLELHGLSVAVHEEDPKGASIEEALFRTVEEVSADILVMGAYGHSRLREFALGGVTRHALKGSTTPIFMVH